MDSVLGRDDELSLVRGFVAGASGGTAALVLEGEAGIGKTTLWRAGVEAARERSLRVLSARPAAAERDLAYAALGDLLEGVLDEMLAGLPEPRRRALEIALLLAAPKGRAPDAHAVALALLSGLRSLSAAGAALAVDDVQWLDGSSAAALEFALRRLHDQPIRLLLARRLGEQGPTPERVFPADRVERHEVGPLSLGATHRLLRQRLGRSFPRPTLLRVQELSGGNPFFALELAGALDRAGVTPAAGEPFPVPEKLETLVHDRLEALPTSSRPLLLASAALADPTVALLEAGWPGAAQALEPAVRADVVGIAGGRVQFSHPLLASVLYERAAPADRRRLHARLAGLVVDPVEHARHLALAVDGPDPAVAARLGEAAAHARARGAPIAAAELGELAITSTPSDASADRVGRVLQAARDHLSAGADDRARALAEELLAELPPGRVRAETLVLLSELEGQEGMLDREIELLRAALGEADDAPELGLVIRWKLGNAVRFGDGTAAGLGHARAALELAERVGNDALTSRAFATVAELMLYAGEEGAIPLAERALLLARRTRDSDAISHALWALGCCLAWAGYVADARGALTEANALLAGRDDVKAKLVLWLLALVELRAGRWAVARTYAEQRVELSEMLAEGDPNASIPLALVAAYRGEEREARTIAERGIELAEASGRPFFASWHRGVLGQLELWAGEPGRGRRPVRRCDANACLGRLSRACLASLPRRLRGGVAGAGPDRRRSRRPGALGGRRTAAESRLGARGDDPIPGSRRGCARPGRGGSGAVRAGGREARRGG